MSRTLLACLTVVLALGTAPAALALGDPEQGEKVFNKCKACHVVDQERNRVGPHLVDLFGRRAGAVEGFRYSPAMREADIVWDAETLDAYLENPRAHVPGTRMVFAGLRREQDRLDVIAYLKSVTSPDGE